MKQDITLRIDENVKAILAQEIKSKREAGMANAVCDRFLIRMIEAVNANVPILSFYFKDGKFFVKPCTTLEYDDHR